MNNKFTTWEDTSNPKWCEVTLHGNKELQDKRINILTEAAKSYRVNNPEWYFVLMNMATSITDQVYFPGED